MGNSRKVKCIIYIEIGLYVLLLILILLVIILVLSQFEQVKEVFFSRWIENTIRMVIYLILLIVLYKGHQQRSEAKLILWCVYGWIGVYLISLSIMSTLLQNPKAFVVTIPDIIFVIYRISTLVIVIAFLNEMQDGPQPQHPPFQAVQSSHA